MTESLCRDCKYNMPRYSATSEGAVESRCELNGTQSGTYGDVYAEADCDNFGRAIVSIPSDRYPHKKKGTVVDTHVDQIDPKIDVNDPYAYEPKYKRKKYKQRWR